MRVLMSVFAALLLLAACKSDNKSSVDMLERDKLGNSALTEAFPATTRDTFLLTAQEFDQLTTKDRNIAIIDLRTPEEFKKGHIWRATNMNFRDAGFISKFMELGKDQAYALYCSDGQRGNEAALQLRGLGFTKIYHLKDGLLYWNETGKALQLK